MSNDKHYNYDHTSFSIGGGGIKSKDDLSVEEGDGGALGAILAYQDAVEPRDGGHAPGVESKRGKMNLFEYLEFDPDPRNAPKIGDVLFRPVRQDNKMCLHLDDERCHFEVTDWRGPMLTMYNPFTHERHLLHWCKGGVDGWFTHNDARPVRARLTDVQSSVEYDLTQARAIVSRLHELLEWDWDGELPFCDAHELLEQSLPALLNDYQRTKVHIVREIERGELNKARIAQILNACKDVQYSPKDDPVVAVEALKALCTSYRKECEAQRDLLKSSKDSLENAERRILKYIDELKPNEDEGEATTTSDDAQRVTHSLKVQLDVDTTAAMRTLERGQLPPVGLVYMDNAGEKCRVVNVLGGRIRVVVDDEGDELFPFRCDGFWEDVDHIISLGNSHCVSVVDKTQRPPLGMVFEHVDGYQCVVVEPDDEYQVAFWSKETDLDWSSFSFFWSRVAHVISVPSNDEPVDVRASIIGQILMLSQVVEVDLSDWWGNESVERTWLERDMSMDDLLQLLGELIDGAFADLKSTDERVNFIEQRLVDVAYDGHTPSETSRVDAEFLINHLQECLVGSSGLVELIAKSYGVDFKQYANKTDFITALESAFRRSRRDHEEVNALVVNLGFELAGVLGDDFDPALMGTHGHQRNLERMVSKVSKRYKKAKRKLKKLKRLMRLIK